MRSSRAVDVRVGAVALVLCAAVAGTAIAQTPDRTALLADARKLIDGGDARTAIDKLRSLDEASDPRVAELLGVAYYHSGDAAHAIETLQPVVSRLTRDSVERREAVQV